MTLKVLRKFVRRRERRDEVVVIDLSTPITKAVHLRYKGDRLTLVSCCSQTAPPPEEISCPKELAKHFKTLRHSLGTKTRETVIVIGMEDSMLRNVESPLMDRDEMRHALRLNARQFFKEDMPHSVFDCFIPSVKDGDGASPPKAGKPSNVLVGIGKQGLPGRLNSAAKLAGFHLAQIVPAQVGLANAALLAKGKMSDDEALVLLHFGANTSTVSFLSNGKLSLTRAIDIGGDQLSKELAEAHNVSIEDEKLRISAIQDNVQSVLEPIAKEVRAAIDYFDHLEGKPVMSGYVTGEMAQSSLVIETLKGLEIPCQRLEPTGFLGMEVPAENVAAAGNPLSMDLDSELPQLNVAVGAAMGWLSPEAIEINLLVDEIEAAERRRRDPVRWTAGLGAGIALVLLAWAGWLFLQSVLATTHLRRAQADWTALEKSHHEALAIFKKAGEIDRTLNPLQHHATNRFLWALPLNALQLVMSDEIQVVGLKIEQSLVQADAVKASKTVRPQPAQTREQVSLTITAKNFADNQAEDKFIERITSLPYFKNSLRKKEPVLLKNRLLRQVDPLDPMKVFTLFTIECVYPERVLGYE